MTPSPCAAQAGAAAPRWQRRLAGLALVLLAMLAACSDDASEAAANRDPPAPAVFAITRADGAVAGWLMGTIHALPAGTRWRTAAIEQVVDEAEVLVLEVADLDNSPATGRIFRQLATTPDLPLLEERVPAPHRARLAELVKQAGLSPLQQRQSETWAAALMLARLQADGDPAHGVDRALIKEFGARPRRELEGTAAQLAIFDSLPERAQRALLVAVIEASEQPASEARRLREAWLRGDLAAIEAATQDGILADAELRARLLVERNARWMPAIEAELQSPARPLIAVGAAHLVGEDGLVALLGARGYGVTRLP
ncbi:MAG: TraB/GumN family protein [Erythrobacter sp.]